MESIKGNRRLGQVLACSCDEGLGHVHAHHLDGFGLALVALEVLGKSLNRAGILAGCGVDQSRPLKIVHQGDVAVAFGAVGLVDTNDRHTRVALLGARQSDMGIDLAPQGVVRAAQDACTCGHRHLAGQRQSQCLEHEREAAALSRPGNTQLGRAAADAARHPRQRAVHVGFKLKEIQMPPAALAVVMQFLVSCCAHGAGGTARLPDHVQVDAAALNVQCNTLHSPGRGKPQRLAEQRFLHREGSCSRVSMDLFEL